jgi:hypothetical protein
MGGVSLCGRTHSLAMTLPPFLQKYQKLLRSTHEGVAANPTRDWLLLLALVFASLAASIAWNVWFLSEVLSGGEGQAARTQVQSTDTSALEQARAVFEARALEETRYRSEYHFVDPSR